MEVAIASGALAAAGRFSIYPGGRPALIGALLSRLR